MTIELSVLVPCFNEEGNLPELVERTERVFDRRNIAGEIVLVNDGSRDRTGEQIEALAASRPYVVPVHHPTNHGITEAWKSALAHSHGRYVCTIDADLQYQPEAIALLYREMCFSKADLVQGWRSSLELRRYDIRYYMSRGLDNLLKLAFGMHERDVKSGFVIYRREAFEEILAHAPGYFYFQHMITVVAKAKGYSIRQVETLFLERRTGQSFIAVFPIKMIARTLADIARGVVEFRLRATKDQSLALALRGRSTSTAAAGPPGGQRRTGRVAGRVPRVSASHNARRYLQELDQTQWLPREELQQLQLRRLRRLLQHAYQHVGYYRELFQTAGIVPEEIRTLDHLAQLPALSRQTLRESLYFDLFAETHGERSIVKVTTSGATGEPLVVFADRLQLEMRWAHATRGAGWAGYRSSTRHASWSRSGFDGNTGAGRERVNALISGERVFRGFALDQALAGRYAEYLRRERPALLQGDAEVFNVVASLLHATGRDAAGAGAVHTWGQTLTPAVRTFIEGVFGCPVFDEYGARELGPVAHECEAHAGYHVNAESYIVEVVRDGRPAADGELGEVLITDLNSHSVPLLRYQLGDLAALSHGPCACGRGLPLLERVVGRPQAAVLGAGDRCVPGAVFADIFKDYEHAVSRYQIVQEQREAVTIRLIRKSRFTTETERAIREVFARVLGDGVTVSLEFVDALPTSPGARELTCQSRLPLPLFGEEQQRAAWDAGVRLEVSR